MEAPTAERGNARGSPSVESTSGRTNAREVAGISNFTERGLTRPTRGGEKLGQPPCVTSLPAAKTDADVGHQPALSFPVHPFKRGYLRAPRTTGGSGTLPSLITKPAPRSTSPSHPRDTYLPEYGDPSAGTVAASVELSIARGSGNESKLECLTHLIHSYVVGVRIWW